MGFSSVLNVKKNILLKFLRWRNRIIKAKNDNFFIKVETVIGKAAQTHFGYFQIYFQSKKTNFFLDFDFIFFF